MSSISPNSDIPGPKASTIWIERTNKSEILSKRFRLNFILQNQIRVFGLMMAMMKYLDTLLYIPYFVSHKTPESIQNFH